MCVLMQFVVNSITLNISSSSLAYIFMSYVVPIFGIWQVFVLNNVSTFNIFCTNLQIPKHNILGPLKRQLQGKYLW